MTEDLGTTIYMETLLLEILKSKARGFYDAQSKLLPLRLSHLLVFI